MDISDVGVGNIRPNAPIEYGLASNFNYDDPIVIENAQDQCFGGYVRPVGGATGDGPYQFELPPVGDSYLMMNRMYIYLKGKITLENGGDLTETDVVAPINCLGTSMWEHVEVNINDYPMSGATSTNSHYKSFIETTLSNDYMSVNSWMQGSGYSIDTAGQMESFTLEGEPAKSKNKGFQVRYDWVKKSKEFDMYSPINADFLKANKFLAPGNKLSLRLYRAKDAFILCTKQDKKYKLKIMDLQLAYQRTRLREPRASIKREVYLTTGTELKRFPIPVGQPSYHLNIFQGAQLPKQIIIGQVHTDAVEGSYKTNPFYFRHLDLKYLSFRVNGKPIPTDPYTPDFEKDLINREYLSLFLNTGSLRPDRGMCINKNQFMNGSTLFALDLTPDLCNSAHLHPSEAGEVTLDIAWAKNLTTAVTIIAMCCFDEVYTKRANSNELVLHRI